MPFSLPVICVICATKGGMIIGFHTSQSHNRNKPDYPHQSLSIAHLKQPQTCPIPSSVNNQRACIICITDCSPTRYLRKHFAIMKI
uniref:Predicted protein n=1 Tax=Hordeum vulgare subsp. vulgare TaxID=112509 RepID=F2DY95_HORVV|nr:predicted protein [Hordeum vulgare subsp. vulgare]